LPTSPNSRALLIAGSALFLIGALLPLLSPAHSWFALIRWAGLLAITLTNSTRRSLTAWIFLSMLIGGEIGLDRPHLAEHLRVFGDIFLRLIKVIVAPLIFATLVTGIAGHSNLRAVGRMGLKSIVYFEIVTTLALFIGLAAINLTRAGEGLATDDRVGTAAPGGPGGAQAPQPALPTAPSLHWDDFLLHVFPENIAKSVAENQILQVAVFAFLFGIALLRVPEPHRAPMLRFCESLSDTMFSLTKIVMYYAPIGVGAALAYTVGHMGTAVLLPLVRLLLTGYGALIAFWLLVFVPVALLARLPLRRFAQTVAEPASIAFATSTSEAALPTAMERMEEFGVPQQIVAFVIPLGYSFNLDGSTVYLSLASVFVAQAAGIHMSWSQQLFMVFTLMLTSKGVAGVPRAVLVVLLATAATFNLPTEPIFLILGIDALMDMARTATNVVGNCLASAVVARWEGQLGPSQTAMSEPAGP
jgi:proton glutamate symport protein